MELKNFESQIRKTGFDLEFRIARELESAGWAVINNKYYIDDHEESVREIDLVAYKVDNVQNLSLYTTLIISCKKNESNIWALLAKNANLKAANVDWWPLHVWTNDKAIQYQFRQEKASKKYHDDAFKVGVIEALRTPKVDIFAFQEMNRESASPQNDKAIFSAITSLMKAQAYEMTALPMRKKAPALYQFNLLSVVDTDLVRLDFENSNITATLVDSEHYIARYIIQKKETFARIHFIKAAMFQSILTDYGRLHNANCRLVSLMCDAFYSDIFADWQRTQVLIEDFRKAVGPTLRWRVTFGLEKSNDFAHLSFNHPKPSDERLFIAVPGADDAMLEFLNRDKEVAEVISRKLKDIYRYQGEFVFDHSDIPF